MPSESVLDEDRSESFVGDGAELGKRFGRRRHRVPEIPAKPNGLGQPRVDRRGVRQAFDIDDQHYSAQRRATIEREAE
jgi:hypothetical protein